MICKECGAQIPEGSEFCPDCGAKLEETLIGEVAETKEETVEMQEELQEETTEETPESATEEEAEPSADSISAEESLSETELQSTEADWQTEQEGDAFAYNEQDFEDAKKSPAALKIIACVVAAAIVIGAGVFGYYHFFKPEVDNPILALVGIRTATADHQPLVYTKKVDDQTNVYAKREGSKEILLKSGIDEKNFTQYSEFITAGNQIFFLDENTLYMQNLSKDKKVKIADNVQSGSVVLAADKNTVLFIQKDEGSENLDLYRSKNGGKPEKIETLPIIKFGDQTPCYGFMEDSSDVWFMKLSENTASSGSSNPGETGELLIKLGNKAPSSISQEAGGMIYASKGGDIMVYTAMQGENIALLLKEKGKDAVVLNEKYKTNARPYIIDKPSKGIVYISDYTASEESSMETGTMYFQKFGGGDKVTIDTGVTAITRIQELTSQTNPSYEYRAADTSDVLLYLKSNQEVLISREAKPGMVPEGFDFFSGNPQFSKDNNVVAYIETPQDDGSGQNGMSSSQSGNLKVSKFEKGAWTAPETVAENVITCSINEDGTYVGYAQANADDRVNSTYSLYSVKAKQSTQLTDKGIGQIYFTKDGNTMFYGSDYDQSTRAVNLNCVKNGKDKAIIDSGVGGYLISESGVPYYTKNVNQETQSSDVFTISDKMKPVLISQQVLSINGF